MKDLHLLSVNIDGIYDKLDDIDCIDFLSQFDIVFLNEVKCTYPLSVAGFEYVRSSIIPGEEQRGGTAILIKYYLWKCMYNVQLYKDQVWFSLSCVDYLRFGAVYITPVDSPFFDPTSFAVIREECHANPHVLFIGDINARLFPLAQFEATAHGLQYSENVDTNSGSKTHAKEVIALCHEFKLVPINHLTHGDKTFQGNFTFKKKSNWISQVDWALCDIDTIRSVDKFEVIQDSCLRTDHAAISVKLKCSFPMSSLEHRAKDLGQSVLPRAPTSISLKAKSVDPLIFLESLPDPSLFWQLPAGDIESANSFICNGMYNAAVKARVKFTPPTYPIPLPSVSQRWQNILDIQDSRTLWKTINWRGEFKDIPCNVTAPTDAEFCDYFTDLLNTESSRSPLIIPQTDVYIPILDDDLMPHEIESSIKKLKVDKAAGLDGVPPGLFKQLPDEWILVITYLFNEVFTGQYPLSWAIAKLFMIFKKGDRLKPSNYRGISVINAIAKLYGMVLNARFAEWYKPSPEQSGAQAGRCCEEQILVVRLIIDIARKLRLPLYFGGVDFCKAYDTVNRNKLLQMLAGAGCGRRFLAATARTFD